MKDLADREIDAFEASFRNQGHSPLTRFERAILKEYLCTFMAGLFPSVLKGPGTSDGSDLCQDDVSTLDGLLSELGEGKS